MRSKYLVKSWLFIILTCCIQFATAQQFVNGSFELANDSCRNKISHDSISMIVPGLFSFGNSMGIDFRSNSCPRPGFPNAPITESGTKFIAFGYDYSNNGGDSIALQLNTALIPGVTYKLQFIQRRQQGFTSPVFDIGYSLDSAHFGNFIALGHCTLMTAKWEDTMCVFKPSFPARFITLRSIANGEIVYLDNFRISVVTSMDELEPEHWQCFPNPVKDKAIIPNAHLLLTNTIQLMDLHGRSYEPEFAIDDDMITIHRNQLSQGIYFIVVRDLNDRWVKVKFEIQD